MNHSTNQCKYGINHAEQSCYPCLQDAYNKKTEQLTAKDNEIQRLKEEREDDLFLEFGDGNILVLTTKDNKIILSKQHGQGEIGGNGPIKEGDTYSPSLNDIVMKFKNLASIRVVKTAVEDIDAALLAANGKE